MERNDQDRNSSRKQHDFGNIPIQPQPADHKKSGPDWGQDSRPPAAARRRRAGSSTPGERSRTKKTGAGKKKSPLLLLAIPVVLAACDLAAGYLLVPRLIQGPVAEHLSTLLGRPVTVGRAGFSPLNFQLTAAKLSIGADPEETEDSPLGSVDRLEAHVRPASLFKGQVVLENVVIKRPRAGLIRYSGSRYNFLPPRSRAKKESSNPLRRILPPWLTLRGIQLIDGSLTLDDCPAERKHTITDIQLNFPAPDSGSNPYLSATVNNSPILIRGKTAAGADTDSAALFSLQLADIDPRQYLAYLPGVDKKITITGGRATLSLELTLPGTGEKFSDLTVRGTVTGSGLLLHDKAGTVQAALPAFSLVLEALPLQQVYAVKDLTLEGPQLDLSGKTDPAPAALLSWLHSMLQDRALSIDRLSIDRATIRAGQTWQDLHLELTGFMSRGDKAASLTLSGTGPAELDFQGELEPSLDLHGTLALEKIQSKFLARLLRTGKQFGFTRGTAALEGRLAAKAGKDGKTDWNLSKAKLEIRDYSIANNKTLLVKGRELSGSDCGVTGPGKPLQCKTISLAKADFSGPGVRVMARQTTSPEKDENLFSAAAIQLDNCSARLPLGREAKASLLDVTGLNLELKQQQLQATARVKAGGTVELSGKILPGRESSLKLVVHNLALKSLPVGRKVQQGRLGLKGKLLLPDFSFQGSLVLEDFAAQNKTGTRISGKTLRAAQARFSPAPFGLTADSLELEDPLVSVRANTGDLAGELAGFFLSPDQALLAIQAESCRIANAELQVTGKNNNLLPGFRKLQGEITPFHENTPFAFTLTGAMDQAPFQIRGEHGAEGTTFALAVQNFKFSSRAAQYLRPLNCRTENTVASWNSSTTGTESGTIQLTGLRPNPGSEFSLVLALLTDSEGHISLPLAAPCSINPVADAARSLVDQLQRLRLQAVISPGLVLNRFLPDLVLPDSVDFLEGESTPDFMAGLDDYKTLLQQRPHLGLAVQGHFDEDADRRQLLAVLQEEADARTELTNIRREQERRRLLAAEELKLAELAAQGKPVDRTTLEQINQRRDLQPLPQTRASLDQQALQNLADLRARVIADYLVQNLGIPADKIEILKPTPGAPQVTLTPVPRRNQE